MKEDLDEIKEKLDARTNGFGEENSAVANAMIGYGLLAIAYSLSEFANNLGKGDNDEDEEGVDWH
jgi:hypothetical protein